MGSVQLRCQDCEQPATVHVSRVVDGVPEELHLCRACAERRKVILIDKKLDLPVLAKPAAAGVAVRATDLARLECPDCGTKYMEFRKTGRLGCPYDYIVFRSGIVPLLERVQRSRRHVGKRPRRERGPVEDRGEVRHLRFQLRRAVDSEDFERAAHIRDLIRERENAHGS